MHSSATWMFEEVLVTPISFPIAFELALVSLATRMEKNHYRSSRPEVFCKNNVLRNFAKFTGKYLCQSLFFIKVTGLRAATLFKKILCHRCFPENFVKFLKTPFFIVNLWWLLLALNFLQEAWQYRKAVEVRKESIKLVIRTWSVLLGCSETTLESNAVIVLWKKLYSNSWLGFD